MCKSNLLPLSEIIFCPKKCLDLHGHSRRYKVQASPLIPVCIATRAVSAAECRRRRRLLRFGGSGGVGGGRGHDAGRPRPWEGHLAKWARGTSHGTGQSVGERGKRGGGTPHPINLHFQSFAGGGARKWIAPKQQQKEIRGGKGESEKEKVAEVDPGRRRGSKIMGPG